MPSGSHSGGHFGGGGGGHSSHSSGSWSSGGYSGHGRSGMIGYRSRPRVIVARRYVFWGPGVPATGRSGDSISIMGFLIAFMAIALFVVGILTMANNSTIKEMEQEYAYYQSLIVFAKDNYQDDPDSDYITTGYVYGFYKYEGTDRYWLEYCFGEKTAADLRFGETLESLKGVNRYKYKGYTYATYSLTEARSRYTNKYIELATDSKVLDSTTDSVPVDYENTTLADDGEYVSSKGLSKGLTIALIIMVVAEVALIVAEVATIMRVARKGEATASATTTTGQQTPKRRYCDYCGAEMDENAKKCPNCGGKRIN